MEVCPGDPLSRGHHAALPYSEIPALIRQLRTQNSMAARALEFTILTAARSGEVLGAVWTEMDEQRKIWTVPAARMKAGIEHRVPLSMPAMNILSFRPAAADSALVFPGLAEQRPLSSMAMAMVLRRMDLPVTVHGFRSSFRDWAAECTSFAHETCEMALAHTISNKAEAAYRRGAQLEKRRDLMEAWARFCDGGGPTSGGVINKRVAAGIS
jgi:integrase